MRDILGIAVAVVIALLSQIVEPWSKPWWIGMIVAGAFVALAAGDILWRSWGKRATVHDTVEPPEPIVVPATPDQPRVFVPMEVTAERLFSFYQDHTAIQAAELTKHNIRQWMRVTGTLGDVSPWSGFASQVTFERSKKPLLERTWFNSTSIHMYFRDLNQINRLKNMKQGDKLAVIGQLMEVNSVLLTLDNCELVEHNDEGPAHSP